MPPQGSVEGGHPHHALDRWPLPFVSTSIGIPLIQNGLVPADDRAADLVGRPVDVIQVTANRETIHRPTRPRPNHGATTMPYLPNRSSSPHLLASDLAEFLLQQAEKRARSMAERIPVDLPVHGDQTIEDIREHSRVLLQSELLFPQLPHWHHALLATLYWQREALSRLVNSDQRELTSTLRTDIDRVTRGFEQYFMGLVAEVRQLISFETLPPTQKILFERMYERIEFSSPEPC